MIITKKERETKIGNDKAPLSRICAHLCMSIGFVYAESCNKGYS